MSHSREKTEVILPCATACLARSPLRGIALAETDTLHMTADIGQGLHDFQKDTPFILKSTDM